MSDDPTTTDTTAPAVDTAGVEDTATAPLTGDQLTEDLLVEDVSIDGMCGVY